MNRLLVPLILTIGLGSLAVGWVAFSFNHSPPSDKASGPTPVVHRFPLSLADAKLDRETPAVAVDDQGRVVVAWAAEVSETERRLWLAHSENGGKTFASPVPFRKVPVYRYVSRSKGKEVMRTSSVVPRLTAHGNRIHLAWTEAVAGGPRVVFQTAWSDDGGKTFSAPVAVHGDKAGRPGFTALSVGPDGVLACAWLDNRSKAQLPFCSLSQPGGDRFQPEQLVHSRPTGEGICPCCDAAVVRAGDGTTFVAFRDNNDDYRDIRVSRAAGRPRLRAVGGRDPGALADSGLSARWPGPGDQRRALDVPVDGCVHRPAPALSRQLRSERTAVHLPRAAAGDGRRAGPSAAGGAGRPTARRLGQQPGRNAPGNNPRPTASTTTPRLREAGPSSTLARTTTATRSARPRPSPRVRGRSRSTPRSPWGRTARCSSSGTNSPRRARAWCASAGRFQQRQQ